jgi:glycosyltransferase EpsD
MKKVLFVATVVKTHIMQFHVPYLKMFKEMGWETAVASRNDYENPKDCVIPYCDHYYDISFERNPVKSGNLRALKVLKEIIDSEKYDIIHCHTPVGAMLTRIAARNARKSGAKVIYTAHGFHFYKGAPLVNWLLYYPVEKHLAKDTDILITINREDYERAKHFKAAAVRYVPGVGIDTNRFKMNSGRDEKRSELGVQDKFVLLSVGELIDRKNHELVLETISMMKNLPEFERIVYLICGRGVLLDQLKQKATTLGIENKVRFLGYRSDIPDICNASDLFVFMSKQEGLPVALMEAMACGIPVVCSNIRGNADLVTDGKNGRLIDLTGEKLEQAILEQMRNPESSTHHAEAALEQVQQFELNSVLSEVWKIYSEGLVMKKS